MNVGAGFAIMAKSILGFVFSVLRLPVHAAGSVAPVRYWVVGAILLVVVLRLWSRFMHRRRTLPDVRSREAASR